MCMDTLNAPIDPLSGNAPAGDDSKTPTPLSILKAGTSGATDTPKFPGREIGPGKVLSNPGAQAAGTAAGAALAPITGGLSMLIPVAMKALGGLFKKPATNFNPNVGGNPTAGLDALAQQKSFGGM